MQDLSTLFKVLLYDKWAAATFFFPGFCIAKFPKLWCGGARYVRLELLEGVGAFHAGDNAKAKAALEGALAKWERLQVSDDRLAELLAMGFTSSEVCSFLQHLQHPFALLPLGICWQIHD